MKETNRISVLHFSNEVVRGGAEEHMLLLLRELDRARFRLHLVCSLQLADKLKPDLPSDVELLPMSLQKPSQVASMIRLAHILRSRRIQILHSHMFCASLLASPVGWLCRIPVIVETPHVSEQWRKGWKAKYWVDRFVGRFVDYYIAVSEANARYLIDEKHLSQEKIVVVRNGCDLDRFDPDRPPPPGLKRLLGFDENDAVLVVLARLEPQKGHRVLLDALPAVRQQFPKVRVVCVGDGILRRELENHTRTLGLEDSVRFVGYQSNVPDWLALADLTVLPSFYEGLPLVSIESLAAARPAVATAVDGTPEVIVHGETGLTVPPGEPGPLADAICQLLRDPGLRRRMGRAGRQWVSKRFTIQEQVRRTEQLYLDAFRLKPNLLFESRAIGNFEQ